MLALSTASAVWDDRMDALYGLPRNGLPRTDADWRDAIHPDDLPWVQKLIDEAVSTRGRYVVMVQSPSDQHPTLEVEIAGLPVADAQAVLGELYKLRSELNVYRGHLLDVTLTPMGGVALTFGDRIVTGAGWLIEPTIGLTRTRVEQDAINETGAGGADLTLRIAPARYSLAFAALALAFTGAVLIALAGRTPARPREASGRTGGNPIWRASQPDGADQPDGKARFRPAVRPPEPPRTSR